MSKVDVAHLQHTLTLNVQVKVYDVLPVLVCCEHEMCLLKSWMKNEFGNPPLHMVIAHV